MINRSNKNNVLSVRKNHFFNICLLLLILIINSNFVLSQSDDFYLKNGEDLFQKGEQLFLEFDLKNNESLASLEKSISFFTEIGEQQTRYYWVAKTTYLMGIIEKDCNNHEKAEEYFTSSKELISEALKFGDFSDGLRLMADVEGQLIIYRDLYYKTKYGPPVKNMIIKAIKLDPGNKNAYLSLAMYYRDAPFVAGGDFKKSKSTLKELIENVSDDQLDLFSLYLWIETAWVNSNGNSEKVSDYVSMLDLFSNKSDIDLMAERIERKHKNSI